MGREKGGREPSEAQVERPTSRGMRAEYEISRGVRGKHYEKFKQGTNLILLEPDIASVFKDSAAVNEALRALLRVVDQVPRRRAV
jgi:hypothetical protein